MVELSNLGKNYYDWYTQHLKLGTDYLNQGAMERNNTSNNIKMAGAFFSIQQFLYFGAYKIKNRIKGCGYNKNLPLTVLKLNTHLH